MAAPVFYPGRFFVTTCPVVKIENIDTFSLLNFK